jgi:predicted Zn-dependent protease
MLESTMIHHSLASGPILTTFKQAAHVIANHAGEQMTRELGMVMIIQILSFLGWFGMDGMGSIGEFLRHFLVRLPHSRELEREADIIGLHLLARCCVYDPQEMPKVFSRLQAGEGEALMLSEYLGTHPLHASRIEQQKEMLPRIMQERSRCCS